MKINVKAPINDIRGRQLNEVFEKGGEKTLLTLGDMLLGFLSQNIKMERNKEAFWVLELGMMIADSKGEIEVSGDKLDFLRKIVEENKVLLANGKEDIYFVPFVYAQVMGIFSKK